MRISWVMLALAFVVSGAPRAEASEFKIIHDFEGGVGAGNWSSSPLVMDASGVLYGVNGTKFFGLHPPATAGKSWTMHVLASIQTDGYYQIRPYFPDKDHAIIPSGCGVGEEISEYTRPKAGYDWICKSLYKRKSSIEGDGFSSGVVRGWGGALYGVTDRGGSANQGVVYRLSPPVSSKSPWTYQVIHHFKGGRDGCHPRAGLVSKADGTLYGTTGQCGLEENGTIFSLTPPAATGGKWKKRTIYTLSGGTNGSWPNELNMNKAGEIFGTTYSGGSHGVGTVFRLIAPTAGVKSWSKRTILNFDGFNGAMPSSRVTFARDGSLYGTAFSGGIIWGYGTVYEIRPVSGSPTSWRFRRLHAFQGYTNGSAPIAPVFVTSDKVLYGVTRDGGTKAGGTIYRIVP